MQRLKKKLISLIIRSAIEILGFTLRIRIVQGDEILKNLVKEKKPVIFSFWHNRIFFISYFLLKHSHRKGLRLSVPISQSKDGDLISGVVESWKGRTVRGSSSRGGYSAIKDLVRSIRDGYALVTTPDGPRGPVYKFQAGSIYISSIAKVPIVPVSCAFEKAWVFKSWDKFMIPKFFSRVEVRIGNPVQAEKDLHDDNLAQYQKSLENALMELSPEFISKTAATAAES